MVEYIHFKTSFQRVNSIFKRCLPQAFLHLSTSRESWWLQSPGHGVQPGISALKYCPEAQPCAHSIFVANIQIRRTI